MFLGYFVKSIAAANKPIFFLSGVTCSELYITSDHYVPHYYCPKKMDKLNIWPAFTQTEQNVNCLLSYAAQRVNPQTMDLYDENHEITTDVIGTTAKVSGANYLLNYFKGKGYTENVDFFAVPYDWRLSVKSSQQKQNLFDKLKESIEKAVQNNENKPVVLIGFSMGTLMVNYFLSQFTSKEWNTQYVDCVGYIAPAFSGSSLAIEPFIGLDLPFLQTKDKDLMFTHAGRIPAVYMLFPNYEAYGDYPLVEGPDGTKYNAKNLITAFEHFPTIKGESYSVFKLCEYILTQGPRDTGIRSVVIYNTKIQMNGKYKFTKWSQPPTIETVPSDGTVPAIGIEWACNKWGKVTCKNTDCEGTICTHSGLVANPVTHDTLYNFITQSP